MRDEVNWWLKQALADFNSAKNSRVSGDYHTSAFSVHQSVEKALKALYIYKNKTSALKTHNLIQLGKELEIPLPLLTFCSILSPEYSLSRYPDASYGVPAERYTKEIIENYIKHCGEVLEWVQSQIKT